MSFVRVSLLSGDVLRQGNLELLEEWRRDSTDQLWVDIQNPTQEIIEPLLEERFGFHELAAEDSLSTNTWHVAHAHMPPQLAVTPNSCSRSASMSLRPS